MRIDRREEVAKIIDGQHRIAGLKGYKGPPFQLNVCVFVDMDKETQALTFATINLKQTKVTRSLAYDLYEYAKHRSPQKSAHDIVKLLNQRDGSPFQGRIKLLGRASGGEMELLTQAGFIDRLLPYITTSEIKDRDLIKRGKKPERANESEEQQLIFRNMWLDEKDAEIAKILWNYFDAVRIRWTQAWDEKRIGRILNRTTGLGGLIDFLRDAYLSLGGPGQVVGTKAFLDIFERIDLDATEFTTDNYPPGGAGEAALYRDLKTRAGLTRRRE